MGDLRFVRSPIFFVHLRQPFDAHFYRPVAAGTRPFDLAPPWARRFEKVILLTFYTYFLVPNPGSRVYARRYGGCPAGDLRNAGRGTSVFVSQAGQVLSQRPTDWLLAFGATLAPISIVRPVAGPPHAFVGAAALLMGSGHSVSDRFQEHAGKTLWNCGCEPRNLCFRPYRLVRHPIYMGYLLPTSDS